MFILQTNRLLYAGKLQFKIKDNFLSIIRPEIGKIVLISFKDGCQSAILNLTSMSISTLDSAYPQTASLKINEDSISISLGDMRKNVK